MGKGPLPSALYPSLYISLYLLFSHPALKVVDFFGKLLLRWWCVCVGTHGSASSRHKRRAAAMDEGRGRVGVPCVIVDVDVGLAPTSRAASSSERAAKSTSVASWRLSL